MPMLFDSVLVDAQPRITANGYLVATAKVARTGIQIYAGSELGRPDLKLVRVYRPSEEVFSQDTMRSFAHRPMTNDHPAALVDAGNWKQFSIGHTGDEVARDGDYVKVPLVMMDAAAIADYQAGKRQLSMGYESEIEWKQGVTEKGEQYDAIQRKIINNHLALVDKGRAGGAQIGDTGGHPNKPETKDEGRKMADKRKIVIDGLTIEVDEAAVEVITKLQTALKEAQEKAEAGAEEAEAKQAEADKQLAQKDAEIADLKGKVLTGVQLDAEIKSRVELMTKAKKIADVDYSGKSAADIRKAAVIAAIGDSVKDKSEAYIEARFDALLDGVFGNQSSTQHKDSVDINAAYRNRIANAWRGKK